MSSITVTYLSDVGVLKLSTFGVFDLNADKQLIAKGLEEGAKHEATRYLVDHRLAEVVIKTMYVADMPQIEQGGGVPDHFRIALLYSESQRSADVIQHYEDLMVVQGLQRRVFTDERQAIEWLIQRQ